MARNKVCGRHGANQAGLPTMIPSDTGSMVDWQESRAFLRALTQPELHPCKLTAGGHAKGHHILRGQPPLNDSLTCGIATGSYRAPL